MITLQPFPSTDKQKNLARLLVEELKVKRTTRLHPPR